MKGTASAATGGVWASSVSERSPAEVDRLNMAVYECLFGYLPFVAKNRMRVREKM